MKGAIETMVGIVMVAFMVCLGTAYITASLNTERAQNYHAAVVMELEASNYADAVINSCTAKAIRNGYKALKITKLRTVNDEPYAKVVLDYDYTIPLMNLSLEHEIVGYAR